MAYFLLPNTGNQVGATVSGKMALDLLSPKERDEVERELLVAYAKSKNNSLEPPQYIALKDSHHGFMAKTLSGLRLVFIPPLQENLLILKAIFRPEHLPSSA